MRKTPIQEVIQEIDQITSMWNDPSNEMDFNHTMEVFKSRCIEKLEDEKKFTEKWFDRGMNWKKSPINFEESWNRLYTTKDSTGNQAREYSSPLIEELLNEVTSEEMERANKQMKQSSIEWLIENLAMAYPKVQEMRLVDKAKWMHKEEHRKTFNQGLMSNFQNFEDYYNETFNNPIEIKAGYSTEDLVDDFVQRWRQENNTEEAVYAAYHYDAMVAFAEHCRTYNSQAKTNELAQLRKLAGLLQSAWHNGNWKAETPNEREMEKIMTEQGYWPVLSNPNQIGKLTPKQKAEDLWLSYYELIDDSYSSPAAKEMARGYARIAVDEILNNFGLGLMEKNHYTTAGAIEFYEQVKQEIENL